jgi:uncharacterized membrane protein YedE/YeeE
MLSAMAIEVQRPKNIQVRFARDGTLRADRLESLVLAMAWRALLIGVAIGILLVTGSGIASIAFVGVIALGAALLSWEP